MAAGCCGEMRPEAERKEKVRGGLREGGAEGVSAPAGRPASSQEGDELL